jgi:endonuclease G, mitochondrial
MMRFCSLIFPGPRFLTVLVGFVLLVQPTLPAQRTGGGAAAHLEFGDPGGEGVFLDKGYFVLRYDEEARVPEWVAYRLRSSDLTGAVDRTDDFRADEALEEDARSEPRDYALSGYDQGHMAPAEDFSRSERAMRTTFLLSNMAPQRPKLNRGKWRALENQVRKLANEAGTVWVITGTLFSDRRPAHHRQTIGKGRVSVPTDFYKVVLARDSGGGFSTYAFVMPNSLNPLTKPPSGFVRSIDDVERLSALNFFSSLDDALEEGLESEVAEWPF